MLKLLIDEREDSKFHLTTSKYLVCDVCQRYGGTPAVLRYLLDNGMIHGDCMTGAWVCNGYASD